MQKFVGFEHTKVGKNLTQPCKAPQIIDFALTKKKKKTHEIGFIGS